jgi:protein phosphatase
VAALVAIVIVVGLIGGGGYLASRQLFFVGTDAQGVVTIFRGFPYDLPLGVKLYEQFYTSGVPIQVVPAARRKQLLNHQLRSQGDAISLVHAAELGQLSR